MERNPNRTQSQFHYGSIQIWIPEHQIARVYFVSIPLWFDSNQSKTIQHQRRNGSQFHYGSIQIRSKGFLKASPRKSLNSTMVRFKLPEPSESHRTSNQSQFHYGSIQINNTIRYSNGMPMVSIPLWFDSNNWNDITLHIIK